jgi:alpha-glucosidase
MAASMGIWLSIMQVHGHFDMICIPLFFLFSFSSPCRRWGYHDINETKEQVQKMREANIPLEGG